MGGTGAFSVLVVTVLMTYGAIAALALGAVDVGMVLRLPAAAVNTVTSITLSPSASATAG